MTSYPRSTTQLEASATSSEQRSSTPQQTALPAPTGAPKGQATDIHKFLTTLSRLCVSQADGQACAIAANITQPTIQLLLSDTGDASEKTTVFLKELWRVLQRGGALHFQKAGTTGKSIKKSAAEEYAAKKEMKYIFFTNVFKVILAHSWPRLQHLTTHHLPSFRAAVRATTAAVRANKKARKAAAATTSPLPKDKDALADLKLIRNILKDLKHKYPTCPTTADGFEEVADHFDTVDTVFRDLKDSEAFKVWARDQEAVFPYMRYLGAVCEVVRDVNWLCEAARTVRYREYFCRAMDVITISQPPVDKRNTLCHAEAVDNAGSGSMLDSVINHANGNPAVDFAPWTTFPTTTEHESSDKLAIPPKVPQYVHSELGVINYILAHPSSSDWFTGIGISGPSCHSRHIKAQALNGVCELNFCVRGSSVKFDDDVKSPEFVGLSEKVKKAVAVLTHLKISKFFVGHFGRGKKLS